MKHDAVIKVQKGTVPLVGTVLWGTMYGDQKGRFVDGTVLHTSRIREVSADSEGVYVATMNSVYKVEDE
jgi:hypothetical protein